MSKEQPLRLHLGGEEVKEGWKIMNIQPKPGVDYIGTCTDLSQFADGSVTEVYASHVYEHLSYQGELQQALKEAYRVLKPWGVLRVSIPDLETLCRMYLLPGIPIENRIQVMRMLMGGQIDQFDFHKSMFSFDTLAPLLRQAGFTKLNRVPTFGVFKDISELNVGGFLISLNVVAIKEK